MQERPCLNNALHIRYALHLSLAVPQEHFFANKNIHTAKNYSYQYQGGNFVRDNHFIVLLFFSILSIVATTIFSSIIIVQNSNIGSNLENQ
jgi:hypothetical protein